MGSDAAPAQLEGRELAGCGRVERRQNAEDQPREHGEREREREHREIQLDGVQARDRGRRPRAQPPEPRFRQNETERSAHAGHQHALAQQLPHEAATRGPERGAHRQLATARRRARQQHVRDVGAGDQQHQADRAQQDQQRDAGVSDHGLQDGPQLEAKLAIRIGMGAGLPLREVGELRAGLRQRHPGPEARHHSEDPQRPLLSLRGDGAHAGLERHPELVLGRREVERRGHHAHHRVRPTAQVDRAAERGIAPREPRLPKLVAEHHQRLPALLGQEPPSAKRLAQHQEELGRPDDAGDLLGLAIRHDRVEVRRPDRGALEGARLLAQVFVVGNAEAARRDEPLRFGERQRREQHPVHEAEDRGVRADPQPQRGDRDEREARCATQQAEAEADVGGELLQPEDRPLVLAALGDRLRVSETQARGPLGVRRRQAASEVVLGEARDVGLELVPDLPPEAVAPSRKPAPQPLQRSPESPAVHPKPPSRA